jgi:tRNA(Arg) A34 adenosine deaminase TadA
VGRSVAFHEDKHLSAALAKTLFSAWQLAKMQVFMVEAVAQGTRVSDGSPRIGAVLVDGSKETIVAVAGDARRTHPLRHAGKFQCCVCAILQTHGQLVGLQQWR